MVIVYYLNSTFITDFDAFSGNNKGHLQFFYLLTAVHFINTTVVGNNNNDTFTSTLLQK